MDEIEATAAPKGLREQGKARRRRALLDSARVMIKKSGTIGLAMRALAQRAGVGEVTPYKLFGSKRGLLEALLIEELATHRIKFERTGVEDPLDALFKFVTVMVDMYRGDPQLYQVVLRDLMTTGDHSLRNFFSSPQSQLFSSLVEDAVTSGFLLSTVEPRLSARVLGHVFTSGVRDWLWEGISLESLEANIGLGFSMVLRSIAAPCAVGRCDALMMHYQQAVIRHSRTVAGQLRKTAVVP